MLEPTLTFVIVSIGLGIVAAVAGALFYWGMPIAAYKWYKADKSRGTRFLFYGFLLAPIGGTAGMAWHLISFSCGFKAPLVSFLLWLAGEAGMYIALAGFAMIVFNEGKEQSEESPDRNAGI